MDITVCKLSEGIPHIGLGVNSNQTIGRRVNKNIPSLLKLPVLLGSNIFGEVSKDDMKSASTCKTIKSTKEEDILMQEYIIKNQENPGQYNLYKRSCADFVRDRFPEAFNSDLSDTDLPGKLYDEINKP